MFIGSYSFIDKKWNLCRNFEVFIFSFFFLYYNHYIRFLVIIFALYSLSLLCINGNCYSYDLNRIAQNFTGFQSIDFW